MSYKSEFYGREIDTQIKYVKESLPTIIENIVKNIETLSKNKAENSSVPSKTSQIENDSGYITGKTLEEVLLGTTEDIINTLRTEHVEHLQGDEIDTRYKVGEYIPSLILYKGAYIDDGKYGSYYENAPFEGDGIIITHSCTDDEGDSMAYQFALSWNGKMVHRCVNNEEFADVPWFENLIPEKLSQLSNDLGYTTESKVKEMIEELPPVLWGADIDTKYTVDEFIPPLMMYLSDILDDNGTTTGEQYANAPFVGAGIIISRSYDEDEHRCVHQVALSEEGALFVRNAWSEQSLTDVSWSNDLIPKKISQLVNDKEYTTNEEVKNAIATTKSEIKTESNQIYANALKGSASGTFISLDDVSPIPHKVKANVHSENLLNINNVVRTAYFDYRVEDNKLILKKTNVDEMVYSNISFTLGDYKKYENKTITISVTNESEHLFLGYFGFWVGGNWSYATPAFDIKGGTTTHYTVTFPEKNVELPLCLRIVSSDNAPATDDEYTLSNIQVEYGTEATPYKPFVDIENATITSCGENLFDESLLLGSQYNSYDETTGLWTVCDSTTGHFRSFFTGQTGQSGDRTIDKLVKVPSGTDITIKMYDFVNASGNDESYINCAFFDLDGVHISGFTKSGSEQITLTTPSQECWLDIRRSSSSGSLAFSRLQIVEGTDIGDYQPYEGKHYKPDANGTLEIDSISPIMNILSDTPNVVINADYNRDINKAFEQLQNVILSLGGNV